MDTYEIELHSEKVKVSVVSNSAVIVAMIDELKSSLQTLEIRVVGLDFKLFKNGYLLLLCVGTRCLIIRLYLFDSVPDALRLFLADDTICFLFPGPSCYLATFVLHISGRHEFIWNTVVELGYFAAKILKKRNIKKYGLAMLASEVGMDIKEPILEYPNWTVEVFSQEEIKYAVHNAYTCYVIGKKLLDML